MNDGWPPAQGYDRWGGSPTSALAGAVRLLERATDGLRASGAVEWESRAAELYRAAVAGALHALVRDRELLDETMRQASAYQAATFLHPDGPTSPAGVAVHYPAGGRRW